MDTITCQTCGDTYDISKLRGRDKKGRLFCGKRCSAKFTNTVYPRRGEATIHPVRDDEGTYMQCIECAKDLPSIGHRAFCTERCRIDFWERTERAKVPEHRSKGNKCPHCGKNIGNSSITCLECMYIDRTREKIEAWLSGEWSGAHGGNEYLLSTTIKKYLLEQSDYRCAECGFDTPHPDGSSILQVDHIDGHANNHRPENLKVLCPNCHALTGTFGNRNKGNGRPHKRLEW